MGSVFLKHEIGDCTTPLQNYCHFRNTRLKNVQHHTKKFDIAEYTTPGQKYLKFRNSRLEIHVY